MEERKLITVIHLADVVVGSNPSFPTTHLWGNSSTGRARNTTISFKLLPLYFMPDDTLVLSLEPAPSMTLKENIKFKFCIIDSRLILYGI